MKFIDIELEDIILPGVLIITLIALVAWTFHLLHRDNIELSTGKARCSSLQGEYGGGKCFKNGKEV